MSERIVLLVTLLSIAISTLGRDVTLQVISKETKAPLQAQVKIDAPDGYVDSLICDNKGKALIAFPDSVTDIIVEIRFAHKYPMIINVSNTSNKYLGMIELEDHPVTLDEFVVYGDSHREKAGKHTLIPSMRQVGRNYNLAQLLSDLKSDAPELDIDITRNI